MERMSDPRLGEWTAGKAITVPLASIETELCALWRTVAAAPGSDKAAVTRACQWNLIVRVPNAEELGRAKRIIDLLAAAVPSRVLLMGTYSDEPAAPIESTIEANWQGGAGKEAQIGSEEVTLVARGAAIDEMPQLSRALTVPDVPTAALWLGRGPTWQSALDRELCAAADRLIFDTDATDNAGEARSFLQRRRAGAASTDLAWLRGARARSLVATLFDPPSTPGDAKTVTRVEIVCRPDRLGSAYRLQGWLWHRLGGQAAMTVHPSGDARDPFESVVLECEAGRYALTFHEGAVVSETPSLAWKEPWRAASEAELWIAALGPAGRDPLYAATMRPVETLPDLALAPGM